MEYEHLIRAWNEYDERFHSFWLKALEILKVENPDIDPLDDAWWPEINNKMDEIGFTYLDISDKYGVDIEHDELTITVTDWIGKNSDGVYAQTTDGKIIDVLTTQ